MGVSVFPGTGKSSVFPVPAAAIPLATVTSTTGSPTVDTTTRANKTIYKFTASGTITIDNAGNAEILVVGGGGGAGFDGQAGGAGGAGGYVYKSSAYLPAGTLTVTVGSGGTAVYASNIPGVAVFNGNPSQIDTYVALGGGAGGIIEDPDRNGRDGGSGGGSVFGSTGGNGQLGQGNNGSSGSGSGGGGGSSANASGSTGGAGTANSITGVSVTYAAGGNRSSNSNGTANTGNGAGSGSSTANRTLTGGSGIVVVVIG